MRKPSLTPMLCRNRLATSAPATVEPPSPKPAPRPLSSSSARKLSLGLFIAASTRPSWAERSVYASVAVMGATPRAGACATRTPAARSCFVSAFAAASDGSAT